MPVNVNAKPPIKRQRNAALPLPGGPCGICGAAAGPRRKGSAVPAHRDGDRVGHPGKLLCAACYEEADLLYLDPADEPSEAEKAAIEARIAAATPEPYRPTFGGVDLPAIRRLRWPRPNLLRTGQWAPSRRREMEP